MDIDKILEFLKNMNTRSFIFDTIIVTAVILNGLLAIYISDKALFMSLDTIKLTLLSASLSLPHLLIYSLTIFFFYILIKGKRLNNLDDGTLKFVLIFGCIFTVLVQTASICLTFFMDFELEHYLMSISLPILGVLIIIYIIMSLKRIR